MRVLPIAAALAFACGDKSDPGVTDAHADCSQDPRAQEFVPGMHVAAPDGVGLLLVSAAPAPPVRFENTWTVQAVDAEQNPLAVTSLSIEPFMPDHGHGTPQPPEPVAGGDVGSFEMGPFDLWMPGVWQLHVTMEHEGGTSVATLTFCIEE
ncbi:MAG: hypothetical protein GY811_00780 [Myxococcales bacterium]|nr:hypothetical protein [Myxococcales bacterium]